MRRCQASVPESNFPRAAGIVRVASCPIWWQPMQSTLFICRSQLSCVMFFGMSVDPPKSLAGGIFNIAYQ
jgi:hypothetical protein